jgi:hypothetical protein
MKHITTDATLAKDLRASLAARTGVSAGTTWGSFKWAMAVLGVRDDDTLASIDYGTARLGGNGTIVREDADDGIEIKEMK